MIWGHVLQVGDQLPGVEPRHHHMFDGFLCHIGLLGLFGFFFMIEHQKKMRRMSSGAKSRASRKQSAASSNSPS
jgi:hypothetical protein